MTKRKRYRRHINRDELADAIEGTAYWMASGGDDRESLRKIANQLALLLAWTVRELRGDDG